MGAAALTLDGLGVDFSGFKAVSNVSTIIAKGELWWCWGPTAPARQP